MHKVFEGRVQTTLFMKAMQVAECQDGNSCPAGMLISRAASRST